MARKRIKEDVQTAVLTRSRRRCCICFGLNRDASIKQGQIAHIDHDSSNSTEANLVFLCLLCHDRYDSTTSQSKNLTASELRQFRDELDQFLEQMLSTDATRIRDDTVPMRALTHYIRIGDVSSSAELTVQVLPNGEARVIGEALWGTHREYGPNIGTLDFLAPVIDNTISYEDHLINSERPYRATIYLGEHGLVFEEDGFNGYFGMNVTFAGTYAKA
ncbi:HNH endonuclease [Pseudoxanthomonas mexicana]